MPTRSEKNVWRSLRRRKGRDETGWFLAEGPRLLREALGAALRPVAILVDEARLDEGSFARVDEARAAGIRVESVAAHVIAEIADASSPQPVLAVCAIPDWSWADVSVGSIVVLDGVQDPGNVGALVRTSIALGAAAVAVLPPGADPWGPKAVRASAGAGFRHPVFRADAVSTVEELRHRRLPLWAATAGAEPPPDAGSGPVALALGSEAHGISPEIRAAAARTVGIPMRAETESLNVAAAGAILADRLIGG